MSNKEYENFNEFDEDEVDENKGTSTELTPEQRLENHKLLKLEILEQLCVKLSNEDVSRIMNAKTSIEVDRIGRTLMEDKQMSRRSPKRKSAIAMAMACVG